MACVQTLRLYRRPGSTIRPLASLPRHRLYSTSRQSDVFGRLTSDALGRQLRSSQGERGPGQDLPWLAAREAFQSKGTLSG